MLNVFLTVDTEIWPFASRWPVVALPADKKDFSREIEAYIDGRTPRGDFGLPYQIATLNRHGLKAVYFVEALFAGAAGLPALARVVDLVQGQGHEVQLHTHTEWLREVAGPDLPAPFQQHIRQFSEDDQARILAYGIANLRAAGASGVCAFRAGNYGANLDTLRALARNGVRYDTSYNACFLDDACQMRMDTQLLQHRSINGVVEFPVSTFRDYPGHQRPAQLCACSFGEMKAALTRAWRAGWYSFVIVWHGFELIRHVREPGRQTPDWINIRRFERLCRFLGENRDRFRTMGFADLDPRELTQPAPAAAIGSPMRHTAWRFAEQLASRLL